MLSTKFQRFTLRVFALLAFVGCSMSFSAGAQTFALKTNLIYDATTSPNIGGEMSVGRKSTVNLVYGINAWTFHSDTHGDRKAKHWLVMPEYRWWTCSTFNGHFIGVHAMGGQFNAANVDLPIPGGFFGGENLGKGVKDYRYQGTYAGAGVTYGYQWSLSRHWNIEAEIGVGYNHVWYDKYACGDCGGKIDKGGTNYVGLTKLGLSFLYIF